MKKKFIEALPGTVQQSLLQYLEPYLTPERNARLEEVLSKRTQHLTTVVEDTFQERNASAVVRSCDCFGIQDLHIIENEYEYKVSTRMARGALKWINIHIYNGPGDNVNRCLDTIRSQGYKLVVTSPHQRAYTPQTLPLEEKVAVYFGLEREGVSEQVMNQADYILHIPMVGFTESLNVSVAAALTMNQLGERIRANDTIDWPLAPATRQTLKLWWTIRSIPNGVAIAEHFLENNPG